MKNEEHCFVQKLFNEQEPALKLRRINSLINHNMRGRTSVLWSPLFSAVSLPIRQYSYILSTISSQSGAKNVRYTYMALTYVILTQSVS